MADLVKEFGETISKNIPGFIATSIIEIRNGICYYSKTSDKNYDIDLGSTFILEMVRAKLNGINALQQDQKIDDITISLTSQYHIINVSEENEYLIYLAVDASQANLTMTKALLAKYKKMIKG
jgi:hypothetical protein